MPTISSDQIKTLRERTNISMQACKKALEEASGDEEKAIEILRKKGELKAVERASRAVTQGIVASYIHTNDKVGVLLQLGCESDFVSRNEDFKNLAKDICMHIAAMNPLYINPEDVPEGLIEKEKEIWKSDLAREKKPEKIWDKILEGKEKKFREEVSLLTQPFVKEPDQTIQQVIASVSFKTGENIKILHFTRFSF